MSSALRSVVVLSIASFAALLSAPGCSLQGEGERCDRAKNADEDCDSGLTCVSAIKLLSQETDRCCPADGQETDSRCTRGAPMSSGGSSNMGTAGTTGKGDAGAGTDATSAGAPSNTGGTTAASGTGAGATAGTDPGAAGAAQGGAG